MLIGAGLGIFRAGAGLFISAGLPNDGSDGSDGMPNPKASTTTTVVAQTVRRARI